MKQCNICKEKKENIFFSKHKLTKDKLNSQCKECSNKKAKLFSRTKKGIISKIYSSQKQSSKKRNHPEPEYTKEELIWWMINSKIFNKIYNKWVEEKYNKEFIPSIDRKNDNKPYTFNNIKITSWKNNKKKYKAFNKNGINKTNLKPVYQYNLSGIFIKEYISIAEASRQTNILSGNISAACLNSISKTAGKYMWRFSKKINITIEPFKNKSWTKVEQIDKNTNKTLNIFDSIKDANIFLNKKETRCDISNACRGVYKTVFGYKWRYINE